MDKENIRQFAYDCRADAVGFASLADYKSERSPDPTKIMKNASSLVVLGYRELDGSVESRNVRISMTGRMGGIETSLKDSYLVARHIEDKYKVKATPIPYGAPLDMGGKSMGFIGDISLRHATVAAGLGVFGQHNLVINPQYGTRIIFSAVLTELPLVSDPPDEAIYCESCDRCIRACPAKALSVEGKTDVMKCLAVSQPYGIADMIRYTKKFIGTPPEEQKSLLRDPLFLHLYQASFIGFQYCCFRCMMVCPAGE